ncbi:hypothetical protein [Vibrio nitrifigilis]|uniref:Uncharacterized protein n=1 Tax=Vibrio nitrifigilis TaxID=2789781 RepID=A0ABS0GF40_9VIBR|nr:hypothetical protein [Vibrio nitrifigilis]MBF9000987.1 hypothetical protein [Vibrio nitrifigilis]
MLSVMIRISRKLMENTLPYFPFNDYPDKSGNITSEMEEIVPVINAMDL